ncbi:MAG: 2-hydroxyacid dehydrogenase [Betaproteobacteria bacterium]|jgi:phosphoglycerate dehydrogenase-like enzyme
MSATRPVIAVEDDPFLRLIGVILDPSTPAERIAAFSDFFAHDLHDFNGWLRELRTRLKRLHPSTVHIAEDAAQWPAALAQADVAVAESLPIGAAELAAAPRLRVAQKFGTITGNIDAAACAARGVGVRTLRRRANVACAEHALMLMLALARRLPETANRISIPQLQAAGFHPRTYDRRHTANSNWARIPNLSLLHGTTLGIAGMGEIGRELAQRAAGFGMNMLYYQRRRLPAETESGLHLQYADFDTLLEASDWVVICLPGNDSTRGLFEARRVNTMKPGARLINISRAEIVDRAALINALRSGRLGGFALDPLYEAPGRDDDELLAFRNVLITPHLAAQPRFNALNDMTDLLVGLEESLA